MRLSSKQRAHGMLWCRPPGAFYATSKQLCETTIPDPGCFRYAGGDRLGSSSKFEYRDGGINRIQCMYPCSVKTHKKWFQQDPSLIIISKTRENHQ